MSKNLKICLGISYLLILFSFLYFIFISIQVTRLDDFNYYKELQLKLDTFISSNIIINLIYFLLFSIIWVALLGFGSPILIISGILFGQLLGTIISVISISVGAFDFVFNWKFFFRDLVKINFRKKIQKYMQLFQKNEFFTSLFIDLLEGWAFRLDYKI